MIKLNNKPSFGTLVKEYLLITLGLTMYALGWAMFLTPNGMIGGGVTGFAAILQYATNGLVPISVTYFVLNIILSHSRNQDTRYRLRCKDHICHHHDFHHAGCDARVHSGGFCG